MQPQYEYYQIRIWPTWFITTLNLKLGSLCRSDQLDPLNSAIEPYVPSSTKRRIHCTQLLFDLLSITDARLSRPLHDQLDLCSIAAQSSTRSIHDRFSTAWRLEFFDIPLFLEVRVMPTNVD